MTITRDELIEILAANEAKADGTPLYRSFLELSDGQKNHYRNRAKNRLKIISSAGLAVVPVEATEKMHDAVRHSQSHRGDYLDHVYETMVRAADLAKEPGQ